MGCSGKGEELDLMIPVGVFQLRIFIILEWVRRDL